MRWCGVGVICVGVIVGNLDLYYLFFVFVVVEGRWWGVGV